MFIHPVIDDIYQVGKVSYFIMATCKKNELYLIILVTWHIILIFTLHLAIDHRQEGN